MPKATAPNLDRLRPAEKAIYQRLRPLIGRSDVDQMVAHLRKAHPVWSDVYNVTAERVAEVLHRAGLADQIQVAPQSGQIDRPLVAAPSLDTLAVDAPAINMPPVNTPPANASLVAGPAGDSPFGDAPTTGRPGAGPRPGRRRDSGSPNDASQPASFSAGADSASADASPGEAGRRSRRSSPRPARVVPFGPVGVEDGARLAPEELSTEEPASSVAPRRVRSARGVAPTPPVPSEVLADRSIELDQTPTLPMSSDDVAVDRGEPEAAPVEAGKARSGSSASRAASKKRPAGSVDEILQQMEAIEAEVARAHAEIEQVNRRIAELERRRQAMADQLALTLRSRVPAEILRLAAAETNKTAQTAEQAG